MDLHDLLVIVATWLLVIPMNVIPAFMPPTWAVLAVVRLTSGVPLLPLTIGAAAASALGRMLLALASRGLGRHLPETDRKNAESLGRFVNRHRRWREPLVFLYCLGPFPSNPILIAAGVGRIPLVPVTIAFFLSRAIADTFWVWTAGKASEGLGDLFLDKLTDWRFVAVQVVSIVALALVFRLPWSKWLGLGGHDDHSSTRKGESPGMRSRSSAPRPATGSEGRRT